MATYTLIEKPDVDALLHGYNLPKCERLFGIPAGSVNSNYEVVTGTTRLFLRLYEEQDRAGAEAEARLLTILAERGVETPAPLPRRDGARISDVRGKPAALFPWRDGGMRCQASVRPEDCENVGAALARVHVASQHVEVGAGRFREEDLRVRLERIAACDRPELSALAALLEKSLTRWSAARDRSLPRGLVHGDLFRDNVLFAEDGSVAALLDFESASEGVLAYDLMVTMLAFCVDDDLELELAQALVRGYESVRPLEAREKAGLLSEGALAALRFSITRITDYAMRPPERDRVMKDYRRFLMRLRKMETIAEKVGSGGFALALGL